MWCISYINPTREFTQFTLNPMNEIKVHFIDPTGSNYHFSAEFAAHDLVIDNS